MARNPSVDWVALKREYVFSEPEITLSEMAEKYGIARSGLAAKAAGPEGGMSWFEERKEFRRRLGENTLIALADKWAAYETKAREKMMETANAALDNFIAQLNDKDSKIKIGSKEAVEWIKVMRELFDDIRNAARPDNVIDGEATFMDEASAREMMAKATALLDAGGPDDGVSTE